jgi:hydrogenase maturation factor HypF (carbamoyltransferase family)
MDNPIVSRVVTDFERVTMAEGLICPACKAPFTPHAMRRYGAEITLRCNACHADALTCRLESDE